MKRLDSANAQKRPTGSFLDGGPSDVLHDREASAPGLTPLSSVEILCISASSSETSGGNYEVFRILSSGWFRLPTSLGFLSSQLAASFGGNAVRVLRAFSRNIFLNPPLQHFPRRIECDVCGHPLVLGCFQLRD